MEVLLGAEAIARRVGQLGEQITADYRDRGARGPLFIGLLKGSFVFLADLVRRVDLPLEIDFMALASYGRATVPGAVSMLKDIAADVAGRDVLIVEDICDTGRSLRAAQELIAGRAPASLRTCVLLDKPSRREVEVPLDYIGFEIPDRFVVGYGLDIEERHRNLPDIVAIDPGPGR